MAAVSIFLITVAFWLHLAQNLACGQSRLGALNYKLSAV
jgi:hypothetical protein